MLQRKGLPFFEVIPSLNGSVVPPSPPSDTKRSICPDEPHRPSVELLPSSHGKIESLLVTIPVPYLEEQQPPYSSYIDIIKEFAVQFVGRQLTLLIETRKQQPDSYEQTTIDILKDNLQGVDLHIITTPKKSRSFSLWAQDAFLVAKHPQKTTPGIIIHPSEYPRENRSNDGSIAKEVADRHPAGYTSCTFPVPIEAGNVLVAEDFILIGQDEILRSQYSEAQFIQLFLDFFGTKKKLITIRCKAQPFTPILGKDLKRSIPKLTNSSVVITPDGSQHTIYSWRGKEQPIFHIDLFVNLLGRNSKGQQIILVGEPVSGFDHRFFNGEEQILNEQIKDATNRINESIKNIKQDLDSYNIPYQILRNPLPLTSYTYAPYTSWYWASYNNCLVEITDKQKNVWLPSYHNKENTENLHWEQLQKFDKKNEQIFRQNGFNINLFNHDFHALAVNSGALHCMTKCLKRSNHLRESQSSAFMSNIELKLRKKDNIYQLSVTEKDKDTKYFPLENNGEQHSENMNSIRFTMHNNGEIEKEVNKPLLSPLLSSKMLLYADRAYIETIKIREIGNDTVLSIIGEDDYRIYVGREQFDYKMNGSWVSLHVLKEGNKHYLVVESSRS